MKKLKIAPKRAVWIVVTGIVVAELLKRDYMMAGIVLGGCFVGCYLLWFGRRRLRWLLHWRRIDNRRRLLVLSWCVMFYAWCAESFFASSHPFLLLLALAIDYFLYDRPVREDLASHNASVARSSQSPSSATSSSMTATPSSTTFSPSTPTTTVPSSTVVSSAEPAAPRSAVAPAAPRSATSASTSTPRL